MRILIFNWRDITHPWAGGAERHLHELAKQWAREGNKVTFLVGGYKGALKRDVIDGVEIIRVGNTYSIFFFAPIYYLLKLRDIKFDCVIDTAHGISFFTPLYVGAAKALIVHHNHKRLWETEFGGLVSKIGVFLENNIIPWLYKKIPVVTLSQSEKRFLTRMGFRKIFSVPPGVDHRFFKVGSKRSRIPTILYLGRLRRYKRVEILFNVFSEVKEKVPDVRLIIAGDG